MRYCKRSNRGSFGPNSGELNGTKIVPPAWGGQLPDHHTGTSRDEVKIWVEQMAADLGCRRVKWH